MSTMVRNDCGGCTLCCNIMGVAELGKPRNSWCQHCNGGVGCRIYPQRPNSCREFECLWLQSQKRSKAERMPPGARPDRSRVVLDATVDGNGVVAHVYPSHPDAWRKGVVGKLLQGMIYRRLPVIVAIDRRRIAHNVYRGDGTMVDRFEYVDDGTSQP